MPGKRWDPLQDLLMLHQELFGEGPELSLEAPAAWAPAVDVYETDNAFVLKAEVPGVDPDKIKVEYRQRRLIVSGERPARKKEASRQYHHVERSHGPFARVFTLPPAVECNEIEAQYQNGVIEVIIPKRAEATAKSINIKG